MSQQRKNLMQLFVPICFEILFYMLAGTVDTLMLSSVSDRAVGAVGTANTYIGIFIIMFSIISSGMVAVMTQNIGANQPGIAVQAMHLGLLFNAVIGVGMSVALYMAASPILAVVGIAPALQKDAEVYLRIVGGSCILNAVLPIFASYLRSFGYAKQPLIASITGNVINFILNALFLFVFHLGVPGVATATVISRICNICIVIYLSIRLIPSKEYTQRESNKVVLGQILKIGLPSACETALYNLAMTLVIRFLNQMDANGINVTARAYCAQITNFSFCVGAALAQANSILTGWRIGAREYEDCDKGTRKAAIIGVVVALCIDGVFIMTVGWIMQLFTEDPIMIAIVSKLLIIDIFLEVGRVFNLVYGYALKTSGDAIFPVVMGAIFMFLCAVGGTYVLGIRFGFMVTGAYIGMTIDECARAIGMVLRWKSGRWKKMGLIKNEKR